MSHEDVKVASPGMISQRIIAAGIVIAFCYWASSVLATLLVAILLAYFLDPVVVWLEKWRLPRVLGSFLVLLVALAVLATLGYALVDRVDQFGVDWPKYREPLRQAVGIFERKVERIEERASELAPETRSDRRVFEVTEPHPVRTALFSRLGSVYSALVAATFVPFLIFFMLAAKREVWHATMQLFSSTERNQVKHTLDEVSAVLRGFVVGTLLVGAVLVLASWVFFWLMGLDYPFLTALASGMLNLVPYLGVVLSLLPPLLIGLRQFHTFAPFVGMFAALAFLHVVAANLLFPALVGRRVRLNALAVTMALLFWGWMWGGAGLLLAIPITATIKVVCDHIEGWQPVGRWLGA
jgi:predicted PurR-regulated permease PerM